MTTKLTFIGSGSAFATGTDNFHSNMLLQSENGTKFLIDCGADARHSLHKLGYKHCDIDSVYISHLHSDHAGGLEWLALTRKFDPSCNDKPHLYIRSSIISDLWEKTLSGGLRTLEGVKPTLEDYFDLHSIPENGHFSWQEITFQTIQTVHIVNAFTIMPSYGLIFTLGETTVYITTDTQFAPSQMQRFYSMVDLIFHDCETAPNKSGVHAHYSELLTLDDKIKKKMWLYHYNPGPLPDAKKDGFLGFVECGQSFEF